MCGSNLVLNIEFDGDLILGLGLYIKDMQVDVTDW